MAEPPTLAPPARAHELRRSTTPPPQARRPLPKTPLVPVVKPAPASKPPPRGAPPPTPPRVATAKPEPPPRLARPSQPGSTTHLAAPPVVVTVAPASPLPSPAAAPPQKERQAKRTYIAKEICTTEENYVGNLSDLITLFKQPIEASGLLTPEQVRSMFGNAEALAGLHQTLLSELKERMAKFDDNACIADVICRLIPYMKLYTEYINSFDHAQETLATALKHSDFAEHLEKLGSASFRGHIGLSSLALTPVLRIPRYVLLLQDLKKNTPEAHPDYPNICLAFEKASVMAQYINETKRRDERRRRMVAIAGRLKGDVECLRYCLVQDAQSVKQHVWGAHKKFFVLTKCEVCGNLMGLLSEEGVECNDCQLAVHVKCQADAPERCGPRPEPTILAHFRRLLLDGKARHRIFRPKAANTGRDSKRESSDFKWRDAIVAVFNDAILIAIPESASDDKSPLIISGWLPWHNRARTHNLEITDTPDSLSFSLVCPRTMDTHMLEFDAQPTKKEWLDEIRQAMKDWSTNVNQAVLAPIEAEPEVAKQPPVFHASQVLPKDQLLRPQAAIASVTFQIPATLPVFDAKEDKEFTAYVVEARIVDSNGAASDVSLMKRYSQFDELHIALEKRYKKSLSDKGVKFPELPKKRWFGNTDPDFVKKRCLGLAQYLAAVAAIEELMRSEELHKFLRTSLDSRAPAEESKEKDEGDSDPSPRTSRAGSLENPRPLAGSDTNVTVPAAAGGGASPTLPPRPQRGRALYDFVATGPTELGLKAGDVVDLHDTSDHEWWYGALHGTEGYFPAAYVEKEH